MNKILIGLTTVALIAGAALPAVADEGQTNCMNGAGICNVEISLANTGMNGIANSKALGGESETEHNDNNVILTGDAFAEAKAMTMANSNLSEGCCGEDQVSMYDSADVKNIQVAAANTGMNGIANSEAEKMCGRRGRGGVESEAENNDGNGIETGDAYASAKAATIANSNLSEGCCGDVQDNEFNQAHVFNMQVAAANTGMNGIANSKALGGESEAEGNDDNVIISGHALAEAHSFTLVNSNVERGMMPLD